LEPYPQALSGVINRRNASLFKKGLSENPLQRRDKPAQRFRLNVCSPTVSAQRLRSRRLIYGQIIVICSDSPLSALEHKNATNYLKMTIA
jgi:hypothetical protein